MKMKRSKPSRQARRETAAAATPPNIQTILATTDFSDESRAGVRFAVALAGKLNATVALLHVVEPP